MPTPPLTEAQMREALALVDQHGSISAGARAAGVNRSTFQHRLTKARAAGMHLSAGVQGALAATGISGAEVRGGWRRVQEEDGSFHSVQWRAPEPPPTDWAEELRGVFEGMAPAPPVLAPERVMAELCSLYPLFDVHLGMQAWGRETGDDDYDIRRAEDDMLRAMAKVSAITPPAAQAILLIGGDFFHADDTRSETPASRHKLDMDNRHWKVLDVGVRLMATVIQRLLESHAVLIVRVLRGNHDPHSHLVLTFALAERYRQEPRVTVEKEPRDVFMHQWGDTAIFAHHGDKAPPQRMALYLSDVCPFWSATRHRYAFTGHVHHDQAKDVGPLRWESLRAFCPPDAYAASMGYGGRRALQSLTFDRTDGLVLRALDPIRRAA